jgi:hypothetical protein
MKSCHHSYPDPFDLSFAALLRLLLMFIVVRVVGVGRFGHVELLVGFKGLAPSGLVVGSLLQISELSHFFNF